MFHLAQQIQGIKGLSHCTERLLLRSRQDPREQEALQWCFGRVVDATHGFPILVFELQFHRGLKAVHIQAYRSVQFAQLPVGLFSSKTIIADERTDYCAIFLLDKALIILEPGTSSCESELFPLTIGE